MMEFKHQLYIIENHERAPIVEAIISAAYINYVAPAHS